MKVRSIGVVASLLFSLMFSGAPAIADTIEIVSGAGTPCTYEGGLSPADTPAGNCVTQGIGPHSLWQSNDPNDPGVGGVWVSYADTGVDGSTVAPRSELPLFSITETFTITEAGFIEFWIWADDTADLFFNLASEALDLVIGANFSQNICANGTIGCQPNEYYFLSGDLAAGTYSITMHMYQVGTGTTNGSNPFGVLYSGRVTTSVPEPGTLALLGLGLVGLGFARRMKRT